MSDKVKGITIEFRGNATPLQKAIRTVNSEVSKTTKELASVNKALKFNPTNVDLWRQKQELLEQKIKSTTDKLDALKQQQQQMDAAGVDKNTEQYRRLERQIIETDSQLKTFKSQLREIGNVNLRAASEQMKQYGNSLTSAGQAMRGLSRAGTALVATLGAITYKAAASADRVNTMSKKYNISTNDLQMYKLAAEQVDVPVEDIAKSHVKLTKSMASAQKGTGTQAEAFKKLGVAIVDENGNLRDADEVWQETISKLGEMTNETERDAIAQQLLGKAAANLNPLIEDGGETYKRVAELFAKYDLAPVDEETLKKANEFKDDLDDIKSMGSLAFSMIGAELAEYLLPVMEKVVDAVGKVAKWLSKLDPKVLAIIGAIGGVLAVLAPLLLVVGKFAFAISSIMSLMATLSVSFGALLGPIGLVIAAIAAIIAIGVLLYKNWDTIKAKAKALGDKIKEVWTSVKNAISNAAQTIWDGMTWPYRKAYEYIKNIIDKIKSWFPIKIGNIFKGLKLPHFSIDGKFSLNPPSVPHLNVDWYANGAIFNAPTVAGVGDVTGGEAVVPLNKFWDKMDAIAAASGSGPVINVYATPGMDVNQLAAKIEQILIKQQKQRNLAYGL